MLKLKSRMSNIKLICKLLLNKLLERFHFGPNFLKLLVSPHPFILHVVDELLHLRQLGMRISVALFLAFSDSYSATLSPTKDI